jgi:hypothetical protein
MTIRYKCSQCGSVLKIKDELAGTNGKCPKCKTKFVVPEPKADAGDVAASDSPAHDASESEVDAEAPPAKAESAPVQAAANDDDFDPMAVLMDDSSPGAKASAGLSAPPPGPAAVAKPAVDRMGRRFIAPPPPSAAAPAGESASSLNASANARDLLTKTMEDSRVKAAAMPEAAARRPKIDFRASLGPLLRGAPYIVGIIVAAAGLYWLSNKWMGDSLPLPELASVTGTLQVGGQPVSRIVVHLTPVNANQGKSASGKTIRLSDATGITDDDGYFQASYLGHNGAPLGKVRVWLEPLDLQNYSKVPPKYLQPSTDIREVKEAGNEGKFNLDLKMP